MVLQSCTCLKDIDVDGSNILIYSRFLHISQCKYISENSALRWVICNYNINVANITTKKTFKMLMHDCGLYGNSTIPGLLGMFLVAVS